MSDNHFTLGSLQMDTSKNGGPALDAWHRAAFATFLSEHEGERAKDTGGFPAGQMGGPMPALPKTAPGRLGTMTQGKG
jgi:hypothetical protein